MIVSGYVDGYGIEQLLATAQAEETGVPVPGEPPAVAAGDDLNQHLAALYTGLVAHHHAAVELAVEDAHLARPHAVRAARIGDGDAERAETREAPDRPGEIADTAQIFFQVVRAVLTEGVLFPVRGGLRCGHVG